MADEGIEPQPGSGSLPLAVAYEAVAL